MSDQNKLLPASEKGSKMALMAGIMKNLTTFAIGD
jgi:hypothetical protein